MVEALRVLFEELAKEPTFLDAWIHTSENEPDLDEDGTRTVGRFVGRGFQPL